MDVGINEVPSSSPLPSSSEIFSEDSNKYSRSPCLDVINTPPHGEEDFDTSVDLPENREFLLNTNGCDSGIIEDIMETPSSIKHSSENILESHASPEETHNSRGTRYLNQPSSTSAFLSNPLGLQTPPQYHHNTQLYPSHSSAVSNVYHPCNVCPAYEPCLCFYNGYASQVNNSSMIAPSTAHPRYDLAAAMAQSQHNFHHYHNQPQQHAAPNLLSYHAHPNPIELAAAYTLYQNLPQTRAPRMTTTNTTNTSCQGNSGVFPGCFIPNEQYMDIVSSGDIESEVLDATVHSTVDNSEMDPKEEAILEEQNNEECIVNNFMESFKPSGRMIGPKNKPLNEVAVRLMETWYTSHEDHPYPSYDQKEQLANGGSITVAQVNSWFANRRNRSDNTKPKKNKKQLEVRLVQFGMELEGATNGCLNGYDLARRIIRIIDEFLV